LYGGVNPENPFGSIRKHICTCK